jgi:hypothetical protein
MLPENPAVPAGDRSSTGPPVQLDRPVKFFSIESEPSWRDFWIALAHLLETLCRAALYKAARS